MELSSDRDAGHTEIVSGVTEPAFSAAISPSADGSKRNARLPKCAETNSYEMGIFVLQNGANCPVVGSAQQYQGSVR